jgi:DNA-binding transcriptional MerR regulator
VKTEKSNIFGSVEAARRIGISTERLRYWERAGVVEPTYIQCGTRRFRRFSLQDIKRALFVKNLVDYEKYTLEGAIGKLTREMADLVESPSLQSGNGLSFS